MKQTVIIIFFMFSASGLIIGQAGGESFHNKMQKIESQKVAFITQEMDLGVDEAQVFWPVYNEYNDKLEQLKSERRQLTKELMSNRKNISDGELIEILDNYIELDSKESKLKSLYHEKFKMILPAKKLARYYLAEKKFRNHLLNQVREDRKRF